MKQTNQNKTQQKNRYFNNTNTKTTTTQEQFITQFLRSLQQQNQPQQSRMEFDGNMGDWNSRQQQQQSQHGFNNNISEWNSRQQQSPLEFNNNMNNWNSQQQQQQQSQQGFNNNMNDWNPRQQQGFNNNMNDWDPRQQQQAQQRFSNNMIDWGLQPQQPQQSQGNNNWGEWFSDQQLQLSSNYGSSSGMGRMGVGIGMSYPSQSQWSSGSSRSMSLSDRKRRRYRSRSSPLTPTPKPPRIGNPSTTTKKISYITAKSKFTTTPSKSTTKGNPQPNNKAKQQHTSKARVQPTTTSKSSKPSTATAGDVSTARRRHRRSRGRRRTFEIQPELGKPGGLDDPLRKGLSGCGVRWYLRYLLEGFPKEEAREKAEKHRTKPANSNSTGTIKEEMLAKVEKVEKVVKVEKVEKVKKVEKVVKGENEKKTENKVFPLVNPSHIVSVSLMAKEHPEVELTEEELAELEEAIVEEMAIQRQIKLQFEGIRVEAGSLVLDCANKHTARWLKKCVSKMSPWEGVELRACFSDELEKTHTIFVKLPKSAGQETTKSLLLIATVNVGLSAEDWDVVNCEDEDENQLLTIKIDKPSFMTIKKNGNLLRYRFGKVEVKECGDELSTS